jgi:membrane protein involved in colicin uptake
VTDSAAEADELAPIKPNKITDTVFDAALAWGTLMTGVPMPVKEGDSHREVIETLLRMMDMKVQQIEQSGGVGMPQDVVGITNAAAYVTQHIDLLEQDESEAQRVKQYHDFLGKLGNQVKAFAQRQQEMAAQQNGHQDPETMAKVASIAATTQAKVQAKQVSDQQKLAQKEAAFRQKQAHEMEKTRADVFVAGMEGVAETAAQHAKTAAEVRAIERKAEAEAKAAAKKASATKNKE